MKDKKQNQKTKRLKTSVEEDKDTEKPVNGSKSKDKKQTPQKHSKSVENSKVLVVAQNEAKKSSKIKSGSSRKSKDESSGPRSKRQRVLSSA
jgi:hypothetical protein